MLLGDISGMQRNGWVAEVGALELGDLWLNARGVLANVRICMLNL